MTSCAEAAFSTGDDLIANVDDINAGTILSIPLAAGLLSVLMTFVLAFFRVLNQPKCSEEETNRLKALKQEMISKSEHWKNHPEQKLEKEAEIATHVLSIWASIKEGAISFLITEYLYMFGFVLVMMIIVGLATDEWDSTVPSFLVGALLSAGCGWIGMRIAVEANVRTTCAANEGLNEALAVAFSSGAVMGLGVTGSGILGLVVIYGIWEGVLQDDTRYLAGFGFGASAIALFARVGGGIYTKAADVGADLVGKVEADIPEDDPRNPATIADNVGDNVGDVAGMGADLFESFVGSIIASIQLAPMLAYNLAGCEAGAEDMKMPTENDVKALIALPFWISGIGMICANLGVFLVRTSSSNQDSENIQEILLHTIRNAIVFTGILAAAGALVACGVLLDFDSDICWELWTCNIAGLIAGFLIGQFTEYVTSFSYKPTQTIAKKSKFGPAGVIIQGLGIGMLSTAVPVMLLFITILLCDDLAGTYGVAIAAVGMLSTLGVTLATDAFGPVADNAGGIAEMAAGMPERVRERTDALDALGNTTAATGKGFAIGSAVLTSLALLTAYKQDTNLTSIDVSKASVLSAAILGACLPYIFAALTMMAVGRAATMMIGEVRDQFKNKNLLGKDKNRPIGQPDYKRCVDISTRASLVEMIIPGTLAVCAPLSCGFVLGAEALGGLLVGGITSGFMLAVYMANAGGAWDNAKKWIEADGLGKGKGKRTDFHKAAIVGDTIGDPFKDTSGPALNILIKLMTMISLVFGKRCFRDKKEFDEDTPWYVGVIIMAVFLAGSAALTLYMRSIGYGKIGSDDLIEVVDEDPKENVGFRV